MFCPRCSQERFDYNLRFCSRCGFLLTGIDAVIANEGVVPTQYVQLNGSIKESPRKRGVKQGAMILFVGCFLIVPLIAVISATIHITPAFVAIAAIISFWGGVLRMLYAWMFEEGAPKNLNPTINVYQQSSLNPSNQTALPPQQSQPVSSYAPPVGAWRDTNEFVTPPSVTEETTKLLRKED